MHPLDLIKTRLQMQRIPRGTIVTASDTTLYSGIGDCFRKMFKHEGLFSFWKGVLPPILAETPKRAVKVFLLQVNFIRKDKSFLKCLTPFDFFFAVSYFWAVQAIFPFWLTTPYSLGKWYTCVHSSAKIPGKARHTTIFIFIWEPFAVISQWVSEKFT